MDVVDVYYICLNKPCNTQSTKETNRKLCVV